MFLQVKILASKGLDKEAARLIRKTKELAWQYEYHHVIMDVLHIEKYLFGNFRIYDHNNENFASIAKEDNDAFEQAHVHQQVGHVWHYLTLLELEIGTLPFELIKEKAEACVNVACMKEEPRNSYNAQFRYYATWSLYYNLVNDQQRNYECCHKCILIREEQIEKQPLQNMDPLASYYNFLVACEKADQWGEFEQYLFKIKDYKALTIEVNIRRMHNYCWCGLMYYLHQQDYAKAKAIVEEYRAFFIEPEVSFRKDFKIYIEAACGLACFFNKDHTGAIRWWNDILNKTPETVELRSQAAVRLYMIMLHYEEGNMELIDYLVQQARSFIKQIAMLHEPEKLFLKEMTALSNVVNRKEAKERFAALHTQLASFPLSVSGNAVNQFIVNWVRGKGGL